MGFLATAVLALAVTLIAGASRAEGLDSMENCLLACSNQYSACVTAQVTTQGACAEEHELCRPACERKKN
jgi:hypothetical protein